MALNKERVGLLVDALRSGEYQQGRGYLTKDGRDCCLGVACKVAIKNGLDIQSTADEYNKIVSYGTDEDNSTSILPGCVAKWYGFEDDNPNNPIIVIDGKRFAAAEHNDSDKQPFDKIADGFKDLIKEVA
jgi:hypothetical protein